jgi:hypothetical protein
MSKIIPFSENDGMQDNPRPLPLIVANQYNFSLQHYDTDNGVLYAVQDWIVGIGTTKPQTAAVTWSTLKGKILISNFELEYLASDGKKYLMDFTTDEGLYRIAQEMRVTKERRALKDIKDFLAKAGAFADLARREPETVASKLTAQRERKYLREGREQEWITDREFGIVSRKQLMAIIHHLLGDNTKEIYRFVTDDTYTGLFGMTAVQLREYLGIPAGSNVRDFMSRLGLIFVAQAEEICRLQLEGYKDDDIVTPKDVRNVIKTLSRLVGEQVKMTQEQLGRDVLTGKKLLPSGNDDNIA